MRLIACDSCHTQYDVTDVSAPTIACRCGEQLANEEHEAVDAKVHRCGSCGAIAQEDGELCTYCGSALVREAGALSLICPECYAGCAEDAKFCTACGVAFRPERVRVEGYELPCPVCSALMPPHQVGGIGINECTTCRGLWVPGDAFDALVARAIEARRGASPEELLDRKPRVVGANPAQQGVAYRKCPECQAFMQRRNFRKSSGVIVDVCGTHGTWLDSNELEQIAGFLLSGGETSTTITTEEVAAEQTFRRLRAERITESTRRYGSLHTRDGLDTVGSLLEIFAGLLRHT